MEFLKKFVLDELCSSLHPSQTLTSNFYICLRNLSKSKFSVKLGHLKLKISRNIFEFNLFNSWDRFHFVQSVKSLHPESNWASSGFCWRKFVCSNFRHEKFCELPETINSSEFILIVLHFISSGKSALAICYSQTLYRWAMEGFQL